MPYAPSEAPYDEAPLAVGAEEPVVAADATGDGAGSGEVIVVTAQFREQNPQQTPLAINVVNAETMQARSQVNIADLANQAPNVKLSPAAGAFGPGLQAHIRGVGQHDFNFALEPGVGIYVDDVYFATLTGSVLDLLDLERVEILRGPQGTLAGQNSIGAALKLYSTKPQGGNTGFVQTTYGRRRGIPAFPGGIPACPRADRSPGIMTTRGIAVCPGYDPRATRGR